MILHSSDRLTFGKYQGLEVGMVYLLSPSYIQWLILESYKKPCITDLNFLQSLRMINPFGQTTKGSVLSHHANADVDVFSQEYNRFVVFDEIKYSGHKYQNLSSAVVIKNKNRLEDHGLQAEPKIPEKPSDFHHFIHSPNSNFNSSAIRIRPIEIFGNSKNFASVKFSTDNRRAQLDPLPSKENLIISSGLLPRWRISADEMVQEIQKGSEFTGQIVNGELIVKRLI